MVQNQKLAERNCAEGVQALCSPRQKVRGSLAQRGLVCRGLFLPLGTRPKGRYNEEHTIREAGPTQTRSRDHLWRRVAGAIVTAQRRVRYPLVVLLVPLTPVPALQAKGVYQLAYIARLLCSFFKELRELAYYSSYVFLPSYTRYTRVPCTQFHGKLDLSKPNL